MLYFTIQNRLQDGTSEVSEAAGARWRFYRRISSDLVGYRRIWSDILGLSPNRLSIGGSILGVSAEILSVKISWQAQYLVRLDCNFTASTHWKWGFICDADHWWRSFCVAGAVFGEVGGWLYLLHALEMTDDVHFAWQAQYLVRLEGDFTCSTHWKWRCICDADHWWHSFCVTGAVFGEVGGWLYLLHAL